MKAESYTATPGPNGTWIAVWPGGTSAGWKCREQAIRHANSYRPVRKLGLRYSR